MSRRWFVLPASVAMSLILLQTQVAAGTADLSWDPATGASAYTVYYGTSSGVYSGSIKGVSNTTTTATGLPDCKPVYMAIKASNSSGESAQFSNEVSGWARPVVTSASPGNVMQGGQVPVTITGNNFQPGALVEIDNPNVFLNSVTRLSCTQIQMAVTVEATAQNVHAAEVGKFTVTVVDPDRVFGAKSNAFEVLVNPARFDVNRSDPSTLDRVDGRDTVWLSRFFGIKDTQATYDPDFDIDGDGWVDGQDLAYVASNLGLCWTGTGWNTAACASR